MVNNTHRLTQPEVAAMVEKADRAFAASSVPDWVAVTTLGQAQATVRYAAAACDLRLLAIAKARVAWLEDHS